MKPQNSRASKNRAPRGGRRNPRTRDEKRPTKPPAKLSFWQKLVAFFTRGGSKTEPRKTAPKAAAKAAPAARVASTRAPSKIEVTSPKLYVGNLAFTATENDLMELFNGVGLVRTAEVVTHRDTDRSKGFGFVQMTTIEEAERAVTELHDRDFLGRKLVVSGARAGDSKSWA